MNIIQGAFTALTGNAPSPSDDDEDVSPTVVDATADDEDDTASEYDDPLANNDVEPDDITTWNGGGASAAEVQAVNAQVAAMDKKLGNQKTDKDYTRNYGVYLVSERRVACVRVRPCVTRHV